MQLFGRRRDRAQWPSAVAHLDEIGVGGASVEASGAFAVDGEYYSVQMEREFRSAREAETWASRLQASPDLTVRYNPEDPSDNCVEEEAP